MKAIKAFLGAIFGLVAGLISLPFDALELIKDQFFASNRDLGFSFLNPMNWVRTIAGAFFIAYRNIIVSPIADAAHAMDSTIDTDTFLEFHAKTLHSIPSELVSYPKQIAIYEHQKHKSSLPKRQKFLFEAFDGFITYSKSNCVLTTDYTAPNLKDSPVIQLS